MDEVGIKRFTALKLSVGLAILASWGLVATFYNPYQTSGDMFDPTTVANNIDYTNMLICGVFAIAIAAFFLGVTLFSALKSLAIARSREDLYSQRFFRFVGLIALAFGFVQVFLSFAKPF
jgi:hypothetical protein